MKKKTIPNFHVWDVEFIEVSLVKASIKNEENYVALAHYYLSDAESRNDDEPSMVTMITGIVGPDKHIVAKLAAESIMFVYDDAAFSEDVDIYQDESGEVIETLSLEDVLNTEISTKTQNSDGPVSLSE